MDIVVTGRHTTVSDRFRTHIEDKLAKVPQFAPRARRIEVTVSHEANRRQAKACEKVEITCLDNGPVVRAEACAEDPYAALDLVLDKLVERLRRNNEKRETVRRGRKALSVHEATAGSAARPDLAAEPPVTPAAAAHAAQDVAEGAFGDSPIEVREKVHRTRPMTLTDALNEMELVGHDFFLFHDIDTDKVSVLYKRHGWSYGVLHLEMDEAPAGLA